MSIGAGTLLGLQMGDAGNQREFKREHAILTRLRGEGQVNAVVQKAQKAAAKAVLSAAMQEIAQLDQAFAQKGKPPAIKGYCHPANHALRADAFITTANGELKRATDGKLAFMEKRIAHIKAYGARVALLELRPLTRVDTTPVV